MIIVWIAVEYRNFQATAVGANVLVTAEAGRESLFWQTFVTHFGGLIELVKEHGAKRVISLMNLSI